jgi:hypothetical protein
MHNGIGLPCRLNSLNLVFWMQEIRIQFSTTVYEEAIPFAGHNYNPICKYLRSAKCRAAPDEYQAAYVRRRERRRPTFRPMGSS